ncbi:InaF-D [Daphnia magna]|uniref:InaF-D n=1 Tax=Daphnia magna TaxID=35525 RepID=A0A164VIB3_9CRUS|nr:InaF-D [Daphnia magna]
MEAGAGGSGEASPENKAAAAKNRNEKFIRLITVIAYFCSVSGAAVMLSLYYIFLWDPDPRSNHAAFQEPDSAYTPSSRSQLSSLSTSASPLLRHLIGDHTVTAPINLTSEVLGVTSNGT